MAKEKSIYICQACHHESPKWWGVCPECGSYGSMVEETLRAVSERKKAVQGYQTTAKAVSLEKIEGRACPRLSTTMQELDRVLGGGIVPGSLVLVGGEPGIGKSTLLLQVAMALSESQKVLYVSGEESLEQIKLRANRIHGKKNQLLLLCENHMEAVEAELLAQRPVLAIIDSIQTMDSADVSSVPGSATQIREGTLRLMELAKKQDMAIFIVGHVTKEGSIAGPKILEHLVDTVIYFEGERYHSYRMLRAVKNRFGSTNELGVFEMRDTGLLEINNLSGLLLHERSVDTSGSVIVATVEGTRSMLVEIQALVSTTSFPMPRRTATGVDFNRMNMLLAVLEKKARLKIQNSDIYVNLAGGIKNSEPSIDLGILCAVASSYTNLPVEKNTVVAGEVGLAGEVRSITQGEKRVTEAQKMGFRRILLPKSNAKEIKTGPGTLRWTREKGEQAEEGAIEIVAVADMEEALQMALKKREGSTF